MLRYKLIPIELKSMHIYIYVDMRISPVDGPGGICSYHFFIKVRRSQIFFSVSTGQFAAASAASAGADKTSCHGWKLTEKKEFRGKKI